MKHDSQNTVKYVGAGIIALLLLGLIISAELYVKGRKSLSAENLTSEAF